MKIQTDVVVVEEDDFGDGGKSHDKSTDKCKFTVFFILNKSDM